MSNFSERYGYSKGSDVIIREEITTPINNSILNWFNEFEVFLGGNYYVLERDVWQFFLNRKLQNYENSYTRRTIVIASEFDNTSLEWYEKLNLIEYFLSKVKIIIPANTYGGFVDRLNKEFERHNFAYRIIGDGIEEITSKVELESIEEALVNENVGVKTHLKAALAFLSIAQESPNYRGSIHQSISAVEALCREITGENTLGKALPKLENAGVKINNVLKEGFRKIYDYTNGLDGIRHALMDDSNPPTSDEAIFMLVACSAFINYLTEKKNQIK